MGARYAFRTMPYRPEREQLERDKGDFGLLIRFARRYLKPLRSRILLCLTLASLNACAVYLIAYYGKVVVDDVLVIGTPVTPATGTQESVASGDHVERGDVRQTHGTQSETWRSQHESQRPPWAGLKLLTLFIIYFGTVVLLNLARRMATRIQIGMSQTITGRLRLDIHSKVMKLSSAYHQAHPPGRLMARILSDVSVVEQQMLDLLVGAGSQIVMFIAGATILTILEWRAAVAVLAAMIPYSIMMHRIREQRQAINRELRHTNSCLWGLASQKIDAIRAIYAYGREIQEKLNFHRLSACLLRDTIQQERLGAAVQCGAQTISMLTTRAIFIFCAWLAIRDKGMSLGTMMYVFGATANLFAPIVQISAMSMQISALLVILQRLTHIFETPEQVKESENAVRFPCPLNAGLGMRRVDFAYEEESDNVLHDISLHIPAGSWVCIMGPSGSGKTTLIQLLARLYDPTHGDVLVDGIPLQAFAFNSMRKHMAMVPQEPQILSGTVRENITYGRQDATASEIMKAAQAADCHDFIMDLPIKYETTVGERGTTLSGGQRQRISIARALLTNPEVLLLDDCTSALDANTERKIQETLAHLMLGKTAVIVSQRVSMAMRCDKIIVLEDGRITQRGTHDKLLQEPGFYARLHAQQTSA
jgi:ABC-type multidrug transport system fused ATPase/permease subunit